MKLWERSEVSSGEHATTKVVVLALELLAVQVHQRCKQDHQHRADHFLVIWSGSSGHVASPFRRRSGGVSAFSVSL